ncbi:hypothetical protein Tco_1218483 [Tanacetum coccineum]
MAAVEVPQTLEYKGGLLNAAPVLEVENFHQLEKEDSQDSPDNKEDKRSSQEYMNNLEEEYQARALLAKSKRIILQETVGQKHQFLQISHLFNQNLGKNKGLIAESYNWDEEEVSSNDNEVPQVKALMAFADEERVSVSKESARNDYLRIDLNYVEEQRNNLMSKHRNLVQELNTCKEQLLVLKQAKLDLLTMQHVNTEILKENQNLRNELKELTYITKAWLNSSNKVNQCISEQITTQKKKILGIDQLTEDTSSSGPKDPVFVKSSADNSEASNTGSNKPKLSEAKDSTMSSHDIGKHAFPPPKKLTGVEPVSGPKTIKLILKLKSTFKAETLKGIIINEPSSAPARGNKSSSVSKTNSAPAGKLKNVKIDDPPLAIVMKELNELKLQIRKNKSSYFRNKNSQQYHTDQGKSSSRSRPARPAIPFPSCIHCGYNDHKFYDCIYYPICEICGSYDHDTHGHNRIISLRRGIKPKNHQHVTKNYETCSSNVHTISDHNDIEWFRKREAL